MPYIKLLDGGLVDNFGISGFTIARLSSTDAVRAADGAPGRGICAAFFSW